MGIALLSTGGLASAAAAPPGATPGGAQPQDLLGPRPVLPDQDQPVFNIPPVFDRPLGVDEGDRIFVKGFIIKGVVDDSAAGINNAEVQARVEKRFEDLQQLLEQLRIQKQKQEDVDADGFTPEERQKILDFVRNVVTGLDADAQVDAYRNFVQQLRLQRLERDQGMTIGQLQTVADAVTTYYRERGYFLARAIVPAQDVTDGIVTIQVLEGRLGKVSPEGNKRYDAHYLTAPFEPLRGKLVTVERVENSLLTIQNYPGLNASGVFRPGEEVGTADIVLNVQREKPFSLTLRADDHGSRFTGEDRALVDFSWNSPTGVGDLLEVTALQSYKPTAALFGSVHYERPWYSDPTTRWGIEASRNSFDAFDPATGTPLSVGGISTIGRVYLQRYFKRSRTKTTYGKVDFSRKRADTEAGNVLQNRDDLAVLGLEWGSDSIDSASAIISSKSIRLDKGLNGKFGVPDESDASSVSFSPPYSRSHPSLGFTKLTLNYSALKAISPTQTLLGRFSAVYSRDYLVSLEQYNMGGANNVRGAPTSAALRDSGMFLSLEYTVNAPGFADKPAWGGKTWGRVFSVKFFTDHSVGYENRTAAEPITFTNSRLALDSHGVGFDLTLPGDIQFKAQYARLNGGENHPNDPSGIKDPNQLWISITRDF